MKNKDLKIINKNNSSFNISKKTHLNEMKYKNNRSLSPYNNNSNN